MTQRASGFDDLRKPIVKLDEIVGEPVMINGFDEGRSRFGPNISVDLYREITQEDVTLITGANVVMQRLRAAEEARLLPRRGMFIVEGDTSPYFDLVEVDIKHPQFREETKEALEAKSKASPKTTPAAD